MSAVGQADTSYLPPLNDNPHNFHILPARRSSGGGALEQKEYLGQRGAGKKYLGKVAQPNNAPCLSLAGREQGREGGINVMI